jgi:hypothetical protein
VPRPIKETENVKKYNTLSEKRILQTISNTNTIFHSTTARIFNQEK